MFSDGVSGNWSNSTIEVIGKSAASSYSISEDLRNIVVSAGTIDIRIKSIRYVAKSVDYSEVV